MALEKLMIERHDSAITASTWDSNGVPITYEMSSAEIDFCGGMLSRARVLRPAWDQEKLKLEEAKAAETEAKEQAIADKQTAEATVAAQKDTIARLIIGKDINQAEIAAIIDQFPEWSGDGVAYDSGDNIRYGGKLYQCVQAHVSQDGWSPEAAASLWMGDAPAGTIAEWQQPTGAHDAYRKGDRVIWSGIVYESLSDANTFSPGDAPQNWTVVPGD